MDLVGITLLLELGRAMRELRRQRGVSQEKFADGIDMHRAYYSQIERGGRNLMLGTPSKISIGLDVRLSDLLAKAGY